MSPDDESHPVEVTPDRLEGPFEGVSDGASRVISGSLSAMSGCRAASLRHSVAGAPDVERGTGLWRRVAVCGLEDVHHAKPSVLKRFGAF